MQFPDSEHQINVIMTQLNAVRTQPASRVLDPEREERKGGAIEERKGATPSER